MEENNTKRGEIYSKFLKNQPMKKNAKLAIVSPVQANKPAVIACTPQQQAQVEIGSSHSKQKLETVRQIPLPKNSNSGKWVKSDYLPYSVKATTAETSRRISMRLRKPNTTPVIKKTGLLNSTRPNKSFSPCLSDSPSTSTKLGSVNKERLHAHKKEKQEAANVHGRSMRLQEVKDKLAMKRKLASCSDSNKTVPLKLNCSYPSNSFPSLSKNHRRSLTDLRNEAFVRKAVGSKSSRKPPIADHSISLHSVNDYQKNSSVMASSFNSDSAKASYSSRLSASPRDRCTPKAPVNQQNRRITASYYIDLDGSGSNNRSNDCSKFNTNSCSNFNANSNVAISCTQSATIEASPQNVSYTDTDADIEMTDVSNLPSLELLSNIELDKATNDEQSCYIVVDTNILMSELKFVKELKDVPFEGYGLPHIFIPWIVIQELDRLKSKCNRKKYRVVEAVKYIYTMLSSKHPRFHGQTAKMAASCSKSYDECNDDAILGCSLQLQERMNKEQVILLTNDKNLCNKALICGVRAYTMETFLNKLEMRLNILRNEWTANEKNVEMGSASSMSESIVTASESIVTASESIVTTSESIVTASEKESTTVKTKEDSPDPTENKQVEYILCEVKMLLKVFLEPYLKEAVMEAFGDLGQRFLPSEPVSLTDILAYYKKYWLSVFGVSLPKCVYDELEKLNEEFGTSTGYSCDVDRALSTLKSVELVNEEILKVATQGQEYIDAALSRVKTLIKQCHSLKNNSCEFGLPQELDDESKNRNAVLDVFHHIWDLMNYLCAMTSDFIGKPHNFVYKKPEMMPTKMEFKLLISNLYPGMHKIKASFSKVLKMSPGCEESDVNFLFNYLVQFVPSLQIQVSQPPLERFNVRNLKQFCNDLENKSILQNGFHQLESMFSKLDECIHDPIWLECQ